MNLYFGYNTFKEESGKFDTCLARAASLIQFSLDNKLFFIFVLYLLFQFVIIILN